jgi:hypothetical protein
MPLPTVTGLHKDCCLLADRIREAPWPRRRSPYYVTAIGATVGHSRRVPPVDLEHAPRGRTPLCEVAPIEARTSDQAGA